MLTLDHLTIIAPTLNEGVEHVRDCLEIEVPFGTRHLYMGTHNHRLQLGNNVYLEIVALDPGGVSPHRARWFGLDNTIQVTKDWNEGRRLRGWVAAVRSVENVVSRYPEFGEVIPLPFENPEFAFTIPIDGSLPKDGAFPSLIDHRGDPTKMSEIPDLGAQLVSFNLQHPAAEKIKTIYAKLKIDRPPSLVPGSSLRYEALIKTSEGLKTLW